jgi:hypothetical protein
VTTNRKVQYSPHHKEQPEGQKVQYSPHHKEQPEGHLFFDVDGPCTITLTPAASADQAWLDEKGELIARLLNEAES